MPTRLQRRPDGPKRPSRPELPSLSRSGKRIRRVRKTSSSTDQDLAPLAVPSALRPTRRYLPCSQQPAEVARHYRSLSCPSSCLLPRFDPRCPCSTMPACMQPWPWALPRPLLPTRAATATITRSCPTTRTSTARPKRAAERLAGADANQLPSRKAWCCYNRCDSPVSRISRRSSRLSVNA